MRKDFVAFVRIRSDPQHAADVVENDRGLGEGAGQIGQLTELGMEQPCIEREVEGRKSRKSLAEASIGHQTWRTRAQRVHQTPVRIPDDNVANAAEAAAAGPNVSFEHLLDFGAEPKIRVADDSRTDARRTVSPACRRRGNAIDEFGFADGTKGSIATGSVHGLALHEDGRDDVVTARLDVG